MKTIRIADHEVVMTTTMVERQARRLCAPDAYALLAGAHDSSRAVETRRWYVWRPRDEGRNERRGWSARVRRGMLVFSAITMTAV